MSDKKGCNEAEIIKQQTIALDSAIKRLRIEVNAEKAMLKKNLESKPDNRISIIGFILIAFCAYCGVIALLEQDYLLVFAMLCGILAGFANLIIHNFDVFGLNPEIEV